MNALKCEMCNGNDIIKQDGMYVCQHCGTKYTVEEAKKLMVEGTVKIDSSDNVQKWYTVARRAKESNDVETAKKYYQMILEEEPNSWEANFYSVYFDCIKVKNAELQSATVRVNKALNSTLKLIESDITDSKEKETVIDELTDKARYISVYFVSASKSFYDSLPLMYKDILARQRRNVSAANILFDLGDYLLKIGEQDKIYIQKSVEVYKNAISILEINEPTFQLQTPPMDHEATVTRIEKCAQIIKETDPTYQTLKEKRNSTSNDTNTNKKSGGCYVATAVYGSYDCPEVWTLRRYRDNTLAETWYGRTFVRTYYAISPTLVKWFGDTEWFKKMWRGKLDRMVRNLQNEGVESTPYQDKEW